MKSASGIGRAAMAFGCGALLMLAASAQATVIFTPGNTGGFDTINYNAGTGATVTGTVNPVPQGNPTVGFSSTKDTLVASGGQASLSAQDGLINNVTISVPNSTFTGFILNPFQPVAANDLTLSVVTNDRTFPFTYGSTNGNNFLTITTAGGERISSITLNSVSGFQSLNQPRIVGVGPAAPVPPAEIPEPSGALLLGVAIGMAGLVRAAKR